MLSSRDLSLGPPVHFPLPLLTPQGTAMGGAVLKGSGLLAAPSAGGGVVGRGRGAREVNWDGGGGRKGPKPFGLS
ncbi:hypothetical protein CLOM_g8123 [Closterium sp. NIES-68]|nr:hypothetical protein CLOM_g8123 [Closterium sp. NIES-68]